MESLQMGVSMTEVKDHMEYWLTTRTSEMQKAHAESVTTMKGELETSKLEIDTLKGESEELRIQLEQAREMFKSLDDRLKAADLEANERIAEKENELVAVRGKNAMLVAEIRERHEFAEKIRENWRVVKATLETFQCGEVKPLDMEALMGAVPADCIMGEGESTDSQQESSDHSETLSKRVSEQGEEEISGGEDDGHEASPDGVLADENRAEGSTPANRPMVSMEERRCQLMRAIRKAAKVGHTRMITRKRVMAVLEDDPGYRGWMHDDKWDNGRTAYECKKLGLIENLGKGKWKSDVVGEGEALEEHLFGIGSVEVVVFTQEDRGVAGKIDRETHCMQESCGPVAVLRPDDATWWQQFLQPSVGGIADAIREHGEPGSSEDGDEIREARAVVNESWLRFEGRATIDGGLCSIAEPVKDV
ncbi:g489 [Coccomyxa elongata]